MAGLARLCKMYGSLKVTGQDGKSVLWVWDYANNKPRIKKEMTKEEIVESEKAKWMQIKEQL